MFNEDQDMILAQVNITRALDIEGWMSEPELVWLAQQAHQHSVIIEIGSYLGRSTRALADHTPGIVYAFDDFRGPRDVYLDKDERDSIWRKFQDNVGYKNNVITIRGKYEFTYDMFKTADRQPGIPDMVFIDGSHEYEDVKRDILFWKDKIVPGGLLCGHDINFDDVSNAVSELIDSVSVVDNASIWYTFL